MSRVLFVCLQNAGRSQMSAAIFAQAAAGRHLTRSAGTRPADRVHPEVIVVMDEVGLDLRARRPTFLARELVEWADVVVTMGCGDACPDVPGKRYIDWELADPSGQALEDVRIIRDDISRRVTGFLAEFDHGRSRSAARPERKRSS